VAPNLKITFRAYANYIQRSAQTYRHGKSTEDILLVAVDSIVHHLDKGESVCAAFLDLRKAFDSLDHSILLNELSRLGMSIAVLR